MVVTADINLLPWRAALRQKRVQAFRRLGVSAVLVVLLLGAARSLFLERQLARQKQALTLLQEEMHALEKRWQQKQTLNQQVQLLQGELKTLRELTRSGVQMARIMQALSSAWVEGVLCKSLKRTDDQLLLSGVANSSHPVASLVRNLAQADWLAQARLGSLQKIVAAKDDGAQSGAHQYEFVIQMMEADSPVVSAPLQNS